MDKEIICLVDSLWKTFENCKISLSNNQGGEVRSTKGIELASFFAGLIELVIIANKLPYSVKKDYKIQILQNKKSKHMSCDICVLDENNDPIIHFEIKDYTDFSMFKRFAMDAMMLLTKHHNMKQISLSMQEASEKEVQQELINLLGTKYNLSGKFKSYTLLPTKRNAKNNLYLFDFSKEQVIQYSKNLITLLSKEIQ
jgi:hypothetical protein